MEKQLFKYELTEEVVAYLLQALDAVTISGKAAESHLAAKNALQNPTNLEELKKDTKEEVKEE